MEKSRRERIMEIFIVRHGETEWNKLGKLQGNTDILLSEKGIELAIKTGENLKEVHFDKIYSSPLKRAYETACLIRGDRDMEIKKDDRIKELCFGDLEGQAIKDMKDNKESAFYHFFERPHLYIPDHKGEALEDLIKRGTDFMKNEIEPNKDCWERVMIVAHGAINKAIMSYIKNGEIKDFWTGGVQKNCNVIIVSYDGEYNIIEEEKIFY